MIVASKFITWQGSLCHDTVRNFDQHACSYFAKQSSPHGGCQMVAYLFNHQSFVTWSITTSDISLNLRKPSDCDDLCWVYHWCNRLFSFNHWYGERLQGQRKVHYIDLQLIVESCLFSWSLPVGGRWCRRRQSAHPCPCGIACKLGVWHASTYKHSHSHTLSKSIHPPYFHICTSSPSVGFKWLVPKPVWL